MCTGGKEEKKPALGHWEVTCSQVPSERSRTPRMGVWGAEQAKKKGAGQEEGSRCSVITKG